MNAQSLSSVLWWLAIALLLFWMMRRGGCATMAHGDAHGRSRGGHGGADGEGDDRLRSVAGESIDPVCGMEVDPAHAAGARVVHGRTYLFCSQKCLDAFDGAPHRYTRGAREGELGSHHQRPSGCC